jgi:hypothetical protein
MCVDRRTPGDAGCAPRLAGLPSAEKEIADLPRSVTWRDPCYRFRRSMHLRKVMIQIKQLLGDPQRPLFEALQQVPLEQLDEAVAFLKAHRPAAEVCAALTTFIATAPLTEFETLRGVYRKHCGDCA